MKWHEPVPPLVYLLTSVGWRQDHNGYSHQIQVLSAYLEKHGEFCQSTTRRTRIALVALEEVYKNEIIFVPLWPETRRSHGFRSKAESKRKMDWYLGVGGWT